MDVESVPRPKDVIGPCVTGDMETSLVVLGWGGVLGLFCGARGL